MTHIKHARRMRPIIEQAATSLDDKTASTAATLFPRLKQDGALVKAGTRINWNGTVKRVAVDLWDTEENNPDNAPTLYDDLPYKDGYRIIPATITAGGAFALDEFGWWDGDLYKSAIANNVWTPAQYAAGWEKVNE